MATSLYYGVTYDNALLNKTIGELRHYVGIDSPRNNSIKDYLLFILWSVLGLATTFMFFFCVYRFLKRLIHGIL